LILCGILRGLMRVGYCKSIEAVGVGIRFFVSVGDLKGGVGWSSNVLDNSREHLLLCWELRRGRDDLGRWLDAVRHSKRLVMYSKRSVVRSKRLTVRCHIIF
jgi:hypothetical protein